jgi:hypothetical protein
LQAAAFRIADQDIPCKKLHKEFSSQEFLQANCVKNFQRRVLASKLHQEFPTKSSCKQITSRNSNQEFLQANFVKNFQPRFLPNCMKTFQTKFSCKLHASTIYYNRFLVGCIKSFQLRNLASCDSEFPAQILSCKLHEEFPAKISCKQAA